MMTVHVLVTRIEEDMCTEILWIEYIQCSVRRQSKIQG